MYFRHIGTVAGAKAITANRETAMLNVTESSSSAAAAASARGLNNRSARLEDSLDLSVDDCLLQNAIELFCWHASVGFVLVLYQVDRMSLLLSHGGWPVRLAITGICYICETAQRQSSWVVVPEAASNN